ncbi:peptidoglycan-binding protein [Delftia tsuruhatensis]|uniref:peptidoglycan-binding protein n=1 Tax=Delftia tsuruhatensis TaxID=180282 RepID=UPI0009BA40E6|nr:peptidoglycan-binding protein [Delftia tsuruhatensis]MDH2234210.1 peptidoglycan-binding protein [Delftia tsuruhatensis]
MSRVWFAKGLRGMIAKRIQLDLLRQGFFVGASEKFADGVFGGDTEAALRKLQNSRDLNSTGTVDEFTWRQLTADPLPSLFERCLSITAEFEGHGFGLLQGNFDGAGLTWGVIGFTLSNGEIQGLLQEVDSVAPGTIDRVFGMLANNWRVKMQLSRSDQIAWANSISSGKGNADVPSEWKSAFARLGEEPVVKRLQLERAYDSYFVPAAATARKLKLVSELGIALAFDCHVQNGQSRITSVAELKAVAGTIPEVEMRMRWAQRIADLSAPEWRSDVLGRKTTLAKGSAIFRGRNYVLSNWGLIESMAA